LVNRRIRAGWINHARKPTMKAMIASETSLAVMFIFFIN
jgi:hypothetical protein